MSDHICDKALTIEQHGKDIGNLFEQRNALTGRVTEMETTLYGAERNGGGFIKEVRDTAIATKEAIEQTRDNESAIEAKLTVLMDRRGGLRDIAKISLPPLLVGAASVIAVLLTR